MGFYYTKMAFSQVILVELLGYRTIRTLVELLGYRTIRTLVELLGRKGLYMLKITRKRNF